jgi:hypothetical protein
MPFSPVYSQPFIQYTTSTPNAQFEVPVGFTAIVRQITVIQNIGAYTATVYIQDSLAAPAITIAQQAGIGVDTIWDQQGRWVCPGGGYITLGLSTVGGSTSAYVGGYLLQNSD